MSSADEEAGVAEAIGREGDRRAVDGRAPALWLLALATVALAPFALADMPSMTDLPGHVGRYHVMLEGERSAWLRLYYRFEWRLVGNLGVDLVVRALGPWLGAERAALAASAAIPVLTIAGIGAVSRALHGRIEPAAVAACCFVFGNAFLFGFVNYCLAFALALFVFAGWVRTRERVPPLWLLAAVPMVWIAHAVGWAVLALLVAGFEGERVVRADGARWRAIGSAALRGLAFAPPLIATWLWSEGGSGPAFAYGSNLAERKLMNWVVMLRGGDPVLDIGTPLLIGAGAIALLWRGAVRVDARVAAGAALIALACIVMPTTMLGSWGADERIASAAVVAALLSLRWTGSRRGAALLAAGAGLLFVARTGLIAYRWRELDGAYRSHLAALDRVPRGARIHVVVLRDACRNGWRSSAYTHLGSLAIVRRDALVNTQWLLPGAALLRVVGPVPAGLRNDPSQMVDGFDCDGPVSRPLRARAAALDARQWEYLWVLRTRGARDLLPGRQPVHADADSALYRLTTR